MVKEKQTIVSKLIESFVAGKSGFMARKLTAFAFMVLIAFCTYKYTTPANVVDVFFIFSVNVLLLFGVVTLEDILTLYLKLKHEKQRPGSPNDGCNGTCHANVLADKPTPESTCPECGQHLQK